MFVSKILFQIKLSFVLDIKKPKNLCNQKRKRQFIRQKSRFCHEESIERKRKDDILL